jgi:hypothetical protein
MTKELISTTVTEVVTSCQSRVVQNKNILIEQGISMKLTQKLIFGTVTLHVKYNINRKLEVRY